MSDRTPLAALWSHVVDNLRTRISADAYERWFSSLFLTEINEGRARLVVPDAIHKLWIEMNYLPPLGESFKAITGINPLLELECSGDTPQQLGPAPARRARAVKAQLPAAPVVPPPLPARKIPPPPTAIPELELEPEPELETSAEETIPGDEGSITHRHTFKSFVVGANNQFAHAAAMAVAQRPARAYNPLFLHGGTGLGKTHLMHAIGAHIRDTRPKARVLYITSEDFTNQFINALQDHSLPKFRKRFRQADVLLIDDIQFLAGKERSQEEFFHTFNALFDGNKQVVLSSDCPPAEMRNLESRLASRFEWGMMAEVTPPDEETRVAILRKRAESLRVEVPSNVIDYLASRIRSNVRRLHGALFRVASWVSLHGPITMIQTEDLLRDLLQEESKKNITIDRIQKAIAESFDIRLADMTSRKRPANIAFARQVAMYLARELTGSSYQEIGQAFGGRDHGTIMHACRSVDSKLKTQEALRLRLEGLVTNLRRSS
ncbi:MAG: chromosomal replication initiator protein DnaA [Verrucomicrobiota bacterium]